MNKEKFIQKEIMEEFEKKFPKWIYFEENNKICPDIIAPSKEAIKSFLCQALIKIAEEAKKEERKKMLTELEEMKLDADIFYSKENRFELINRIIKKLNR